MNDIMTAVTSKNTNGQKGDGSPAQIWTEFDSLAEDIFGVFISPRNWAERFEQLNDISVEDPQGSQGFECPSAACKVASSTHTTHHTHHAMM